MKTAIVSLESVAPYSQSKAHETPKLDKELPDDFDARTWREHLHVNDEGHVFVPPMAFKQALDNVAKYLSIKVKGKGQKTYGKLFTSGVLVTEPLVLPDRKDTITCERLFVNADGIRGSSKRVWRRYPLIPKWAGDLTVYVLDDTIGEDVFKQHMEEAGKFIGIGRFRPEKGGYYGRFKVTGCKWS